MIDWGFTRSDYIWSRMVITEYLKGSAMLANAKETYLVTIVYLFCRSGSKSYPRAVHNFCKPETRVHNLPVFVL